MSRSARQATPLAAVVAVTVSAGAFLTACGAASSPDPAQPAVTVTVTASNSNAASAPTRSPVPSPSPAAPTSSALPVSTVAPGLPASPGSPGSPASPGSPGSPATPAKPGSVGPAGCLTSALRATLGAAEGTAGSADQVIVLANVSGKTCALYGYPGVSFVSGVGGSQIGKDAARDRTTAPKVVTLAPGQRGSFALRVVDTAALPAASCDPVTANWLKIFPPENTAALYVGYTAHACASKTATILTTRAVTDGISGS
jgi:Protein of unknown function (DUF4232)